MGKTTKDSYQDFKNLYNDLRKRSHYRASNKKSIEVIRNMEILKIKLIDIENYLEAKDVYYIIDYLSKLNYSSNFENFIFEKPEREGFWMTIWKYQQHCSENDIVVKISYCRDSFNYNARTSYIENNSAYSPCIYTELNLLINYFMNYIFPILISRDRKYINPLKFIN